MMPMTASSQGDFKVPGGGVGELGSDGARKSDLAGTHESMQVKRARPDLYCIIHIGHRNDRHVASRSHTTGGGVGRANGIITASSRRL